MSPDNFTITADEIEEIYEELDLTEEGITEEEIVRRKRRIFVGGLRFGSEDHVLYDYFMQFGEIKEAVVIKDRRNGLSKGYGFVTMQEDMAALKAIVDKSPKLDGRRCNLNLAYIGQKRKPPSKKDDMKMRDHQMSPLNSPQFYSTNGYLYSPTVLTQSGQYYQLGLPPLHGYQPVYQMPQSPSPTAYDPKDTTYHNPSQMTPMSPYQQTVFFPQQFIINAPHPMNNNYAYDQSTVSPITEINNNTATEDENNNDVECSKHSGSSPVPSGSPSLTTITTLPQHPPDIVPISSNTTNVNGNLIINGKPSSMNGNTILVNEQMINYHHHPNINNNVSHMHLSNMHQNAHMINGNVTPLMNGNHGNVTPLMNGNHGNVAPLLNGNHIINNQNSLTTYVTSPLSTPSVQQHSIQNPVKAYVTSPMQSSAVQQHAVQNQVFHYPHYVSRREVVQ